MARKPKHQVRKSNRSQPTRLVRSIAVKPGSVDLEARTFSFVLSTETPVRICTDLPSIGFGEVDEILLADGLDDARLLEGAPIMDSHDLSSVLNQWGVIESYAREGTTWTGTARLSKSDVGERVLGDIADGIIRSVSVGYTVIPADYEVEIRDDDVPLAKAKRWTPHEVSLVAVPADINAVIRTATPSAKRNRSMDLKALEAAADAAVAAAEAVATAADAAPDNQALSDAATTALDAADAAVVAVDQAIEAAGDDKDETAVERSKARADKAKGLRDARTKARAEGDAEEAAGAEGAEQGADAAPADDAAKEEEASVRSMAKKSGLAKLSDQLFTAGFKAGEVRSALMQALIQRSEAVGEIVTRPAAGVQQTEGKRGLSVTEIYNNMNKR